ncbi:MAG: metalloregulator ArsR/SmtB family transcription factor [Chloroflexi bacterium]|nr:metalloregulator ArsR/SmtB family transcription factor [Chloroflexota bacterium]MCI0579907.1 metalloregulator ArsR/SmtB family transcription factor [Chloroflexota bacterium]MCI0646490.1 metalloregulator ArsR/SmtB family transcription factor [Chloroflexota bacterium]MCI0726158.1 metalloregulator ArsR/SmtB family transcription factor [Chloroflexota bacterium]
MVKYATAPLDATFAALADPTRRAILSRLAQGPATVTEIARPFDISMPAISKHLRVLEQAGLLVRQKKGRIHVCHLNATPLREASGWLALYERFWEGQLDSLARFLEKTKAENET